MDAPSPGLPANRGNAAKASILLVDDGPENRMLLRALLDRAGYRVVVADSGPAGLDLLQREDVELIVLDYMMPGMDGPEVARRVRRDGRTGQIPIIMLTASQEEVHIEEAFAAGASDYITKPVDRRILLARVAAVIQAAGDQKRAKEAAEFEWERESLLTEMKEAARIQQARLPKLPVITGGWALAGALVPSRHIGGDMLDVMADGQGGLVLALVDVSGHGLAAALVAASVCTELRNLVSTHPLAEAVAGLNRELCREREGKYACVAVMLLEADRTVVVNAGLPPICLIRGGVCVQRFDGSGTPPGLMRDEVYQAQSCDVLPGDRLVLMSDGLTEPFGSADSVDPALDAMGLRDPALQVERLGSSILSERIVELLHRAGAGEPDDATLLVAHRLDGPGGAWES